MIVWLDDCRPMPERYTHWCKTADEAIELLKTGQVTEISLDHDLGEVKTGYTVAQFIEENAIKGTLASMRVKCHSHNPVGKQNIIFALRNAKKAWMERKNELE